jgi:quercetin dioxygenase-like cupin family protein
MKPTTYPEVGWMKERFQVLTLNDEICEFDWTMEQRGAVPAHVHQEADELFKVLEGEVTFRLDGKTFVAHPGDEVLVPKLAIHSISNRSKGNIKCKVIYSPVSDQGEFFRILFFLKSENPNDGNPLFKAMYIADQMKFKEFSTVQGGIKFIMTTMMGILKLLAPLLGWNKTLDKYRSEYTESGGELPISLTAI